MRVFEVYLNFIKKTPFILILTKKTKIFLQF